MKSTDKFEMLSPNAFNVRFGNDYSELEQYVINVSVDFRKNLIGISYRQGVIVDIALPDAFRLQIDEITGSSDTNYLTIYYLRETRECYGSHKFYDLKVTRLGSPELDASACVNGVDYSKPVGFLELKYETVEYFRTSTEQSATVPV